MYRINMRGPKNWSCGMVAASSPWHFAIYRIHCSRFIWASAVPTSIAVVQSAIFERLHYSWLPKRPQSLYNRLVCPVVNSIQTVGPVTEKARRPKRLSRWRGRLLSGDVDWQSADVVCWQCLRQVCSNRPGTWGLVMQTSVHCYSQLVVDAFWDVKPVQLVMQQE